MNKWQSLSDYLNADFRKKSTGIVGYIHTHGSLICLPCAAEANKALAKANETEGASWPMVEDDEEFSPYFESDRQGGEVCDVCYGML